MYMKYIILILGYLDVISVLRGAMNSFNGQSDILFCHHWFIKYTIHMALWGPNQSLLNGLGLTTTKPVWDSFFLRKELATHPFLRLLTRLAKLS